MRGPIEYALLYPERADLGIPKFDLFALKTPLAFEAPDEARFPALTLARRAAGVGGTLPAVMNAANEAAVGFFLEEKISFPAILDLTAQAMDAHQPVQNPTLEQIMFADHQARLGVKNRMTT